MALLYLRKGNYLLYFFCVCLYIYWLEKEASTIKDENLFILPI